MLSLKTGSVIIRKRKSGPNTGKSQHGDDYWVINKFPNENENAIFDSKAERWLLSLCESSPDQGAVILFSIFRERLL